MAFSIRNDRVEEKARAYAARTGTTLTGALELALDKAARNDEVDEEAAFQEWVAPIHQMQRAVAKLPDTGLGEDEIMGWDDRGTADLIVVGTSALLAIFFVEEGAAVFERAIFQARRALVAAPNALEFLMVAHGRRHPERDILADPEIMLSRPGVHIMPWAEEHVAIARTAFARYGKGQGHPAQLNFGDCMSYALAKSLNAPLLYKGHDFTRTDIRRAV